MMKHQLKLLNCLASALRLNLFLKPNLWLCLGLGLSFGLTVCFFPSIGLSAEDSAICGKYEKKIEICLRKNPYESIALQRCFNRAEYGQPEVCFQGDAKKNSAATPATEQTPDPAASATESATPPTTTNTNATAPTNTATTTIDHDLVALQNAVEACEQETEKAKEDCDLDKSDDMKGFFNLGKGMSMMNAAHRGKAQTAEECGKFQDLSNMAMTGLSGFKTYCATGFKSCTDACSKARKDLSNYLKSKTALQTLTKHDADIKKATKECGKLSNNIGEAAGFILMMIGNNKMASQCKDQLVNANLDRCKVSKELCDPSAAYDCNNPQVALNNMVCKCRSNPNLPECKSADSGALAINNNPIDPNGLGNADMSGLDGTNILGSNADTPEQYGFPFDGKPSDGKANLSLGKGGGGGGGGGGGNSGGATPSQRGGGGGSGMTSVLNGWNGGRGGAGGWGGGSGNGGWADNKNDKNNGAGKNPYMTLDKNGNPVDLRQFLPGQKLDATRGLAGISGPDGITGPNSSLWMKVRSRYNAQRNVIP